VLRELDAADSTKMKPFDIHFPSNSQAEDRTMKDLKASKDFKKSTKMTYVGANEQGCVTRWCENVKLNRF